MLIVDKLKEVLKFGCKDLVDDGELGKFFVFFVKKVFLQKIEFELVSKSFFYQLEVLKSKYVLFNFKIEGVSCYKSGDDLLVRRQGSEYMYESCGDGVLVLQKVFFFME